LAGVDWSARGGGSWLWLAQGGHGYGIWELVPPNERKDRRDGEQRDRPEHQNACVKPPVSAVGSLLPVCSSACV
jgi:hypothetical protein